MFSRASTGERVAARRTVSVRLSLVSCALAVLFVAADASAVTVDQIVALSKAGISEAVILALLDRDGTVLSIEPEQIVSLKREGLSDTLIVAMLKNGREEGEAAARAVSAFNAASILSTLSPVPEVVIVGHGPDRPNTAYDGGYSGPRGYGFAVPVFPYGGGFGRGYSPRSGYANKSGPRRFDSRSDYVDGRREPALCLAQVNTPRGVGPSFVTTCPSVVQRALIRVR